VPDALTAACEKTGADMVPLLMFVPCPASAMMKYGPPFFQLKWDTEHHGPGEASRVHLLDRWADT
jgi:hypothetical protein